ncbi:MAG: tetratricopeptide repeat-containing sensor histidine kinase [Aggregatilineales bacterium]
MTPESDNEKLAANNTENEFDASKTVTEARTQHEKVDTLNAMARQMLKTDLHRAIATAEQAEILAKRGVFESDAYLDAIIESLLIRTEACLRRSDEEQALRHAMDAIALCEETDNIALSMQSELLMGILEMHFNEYASALKHLRDALTIARNIGNETEAARILFHLGQLYLKTTELAQALRHFDESRAISERWMQTHLIAETYRYSCEAYAAMGEESQALDYGQRALSHYRDINDQAGEAVILSSLGAIYTGAGSYDKAMDFFERSLTLAKRNNQQEAIAGVLKASAELFMHSANLEMALDYLQQALNIARDLDARSLQRDIHQDMSEIYRQQSDYEKALHHHRLYHRLHEDVLNRESKRQMTRMDILHDVETVKRAAARDRQTNTLLQREIERRKKAESDLQARASRLEQLEQIKTEMLQLAAHDLRTPLSIMLTTLEMVEFTSDTPFNDKQHEYINGIRQNVRDMLRMLEDILSIERIERMFDEENREKFDLYERVSQAILNMHPQAQERKQYLKMSLHATEAPIMGDRAQITEAIKNIIGNAIKYTPEQGTIEVSLYLDGDEAIFKVMDTGYGIPKDQQDGLFTAFYRAKTRDTMHIKGTGLGLHLVKNIVERHNGEVIFESVHKKGSTFGFRLPLAPRSRPAPAV